MKGIFIFCVFLVFNFSCKEEKPNELMLRIKENKINCTGFEGQTECYLVQQGNKIGSTDWEYFYDQIEDLSYQPGFVYTILVVKEVVKNPPQDSPNTKYTLIKELSKVPQ